MAIQTLKATEEDFPVLDDVHAAAFENDPISRLVAPKGHTPASREVGIGTLQVQVKDPSLHIIKAVDTETGEIAGWARWNIYPSGRSDEELSSPKPARPENPELNMELRNNLLALIEKSRRGVMGGKPHCSLNLLCVSPKFQRRGVGALLIQYGLDIADKNNIESYLESTPAGYQLYKRIGFRDVGVLDVDIGKWTGVENDIYKFPVMVRPPPAGENQPN